MRYKWIEFREQTQTGKTRIFKCFNVEFNCELGTVKWYSAWRKYAFFPLENIVFETQCLKDIAGFLDKLMLERKLEKQNAQSL